MKQNINEIKRMQQLAGILKENQVSEGHASAMTPEEVDIFFRKNPGYDQTGDEDVIIDGEQYTKVWYTDNGGRYQYVLMQSS
jgi:hypothetical protein